jgi:RNA polymerase sigma factor (sigma-70 family)
MANDSLLIGWRQRWNRSLLRFLGRRTRAGVDVEDLAQETYLRLLRARDLADVRNPQAYLLRVASHVASEWRNRQPPEEMFEAVDDGTLIDEALPEIALEADLSRERLDEALNDVSPTTRAVVLLKYREGRQCKEIARDLKLTERQVRRHLTRALERLREALKT